MIYYYGANSLIKSDAYKQCTKEDILKYCLSKEIIAVDIETTRKFPRNKYDESVYKPGLDPYTSKICMIQIGDDKNQFIIDARVIDCSFLKEILESDSILKVGHNLKFEAKHIKHNYDIDLCNIWDTMICERILYNGERLKYSLEALANRYLGIVSTKDVDLFYDFEEEFENEYDIFSIFDEAPKKTYIDKSIRTQFVEIKDRPFTDEEIIYGANDVVYPYKIYFEQIKGRTLKDGLYLPTSGFEIENKYVLVLSKMELRGIKLNIKGWQDLHDRNNNILKDRLDKLNNFILLNYPEYKEPANLFDDKDRCILDWNSSKEMVKFFKKLGICPKERSKATKKIEYTVEAKAMFKLLTNENKNKFFNKEEVDIVDNQTLILSYLIMKKYVMLTTTFGRMFLKHVHPVTKRIHTNFIQLQNTGRISSTNPNLQNQPNTTDFRSNYICEKGNKLIAIDFSAQELRYLSVFANINNMKNFFIHGDPIHGDDMHSYSATNAFRIIRNDPTLVVTKKTHPKERNIMKSLTFGINYGKGAYSVSQELGISEEEAEAYINGFLSAYPGLKSNFDYRKKQVMNRGWIELDPLSKKRYFFPDFQKLKSLQEEAMSYYGEDYITLSREAKDERKKKVKEENPIVSELWKEWAILKGKLERSSLNFPIQGGSATMSKIASILIDKKFNTLDTGLLLFVHDEGVLEVREDLANELSEFCEECFLKAGQYFSKDVKFTSEAAIGDYWIH